MWRLSLSQIQAQIIINSRQTFDFPDTIIDNQQTLKDKTMLMVTSSSDNTPIHNISLTQATRNRKKFKAVKPSLQGIKYDLDCFQKRYGDHGKFIQSSSQLGTVLSRKQLYEWLADRFCEAKGDEVYLFYVGHGHQNGDWNIQLREEESEQKNTIIRLQKDQRQYNTQDNQESSQRETFSSSKSYGDNRFTFQQLSKIWKSKRKSHKSHLYVFMDSCYSGMWSEQLSNNLKQDPYLNISLFASCFDEPASDQSLFAGCILTINTLDFYMNINRVMESQTPCFLDGMKQAEILQEQHIRLLQKSVLNAKNIKKYIEVQKKKLIDLDERAYIQQQKSKTTIVKKSYVKSFLMVIMKKHLVLSGLSLQILPSQFCYLKHLYSLNLSKNYIRNLPSNFGKLKMLKYLYLSENQLKSLPLSFSNLTLLKNLDLAFNGFEEIPKEIYSQMTYQTHPTKRDIVLQHLFLGNNSIKKITPSIKLLTKLKILDIRKNKLQQNLPRQLFALKSLTDLCLRKSNLRTIDEEILQLTSLGKLDISDNNNLSLPIKLCSLLMLSHLSLTNIGLNYLPQNIGNLVNLQQLRVHKNKLIELPDSFQKLKSLKVLAITIFNGSLIRLQNIRMIMKKFQSFQQLWLDYHHKISNEELNNFHEDCFHRQITLKWDTNNLQTKWLIVDQI